MGVLDFKNINLYEDFPLLEETDVIGGIVLDGIKTPCYPSKVLEYRYGFNMKDMKIKPANKGKNTFTRLEYLSSGNQ